VLFYFEVGRWGTRRNSTDIQQSDHATRTGQMKEVGGTDASRKESSEILWMMTAGAARILLCFILHRLKNKRRQWSW